MKFPFNFLSKPAPSTKDCEITQQNFMILSKTHTSYNQALKKWSDLQKSKNKGLLSETSEFYKDLMRVQHKKIEKPSRNNRAPLSNITNLSSRSSYLEDSLKEKGAECENKINYQVLSFLNRQNKELILFKCFEEKDLGFPAEMANKTINHSIDNDVATDEEQVKSAIENLKKFVKESAEKRKNSEHSGNSAKNEKEKNKRAILIR